MALDGRVCGSVLVVVVFASLRALLDPFLGDRQQLMPCVAAMLVVTAWGRLGPMLPATVAGFVASWYFFVPPRYSFAVDPGHATSLIVDAALIVGVMACLAWWRRPQRPRDGTGGEVYGGQRLLAVEDAQHRRPDAGPTAPLEQFRSLALQAPIGIIQADKDGIVTFANSAWCAIAGVAPHEVIGRPLPTLSHPDDLPETTRAWEQSVAERRSYRHTVRMLRADGRYRTVLACTTPLFDGGFAGSISSVFDITESLDIAAQQKVTESYIRGLMDNTAAVVYLKDLDGRFLLVNRRYDVLFPHMKDACIGTASDRWFPPEVAARFAADAAVKRTLAPLSIEEEVPMAGTIRHYLTVKFPVFDADGQLTAVGGMATDITDLKIARSALEQNERVLHKLLDVQEHEKQFLCHEFHDGPIQYAVGAHMLLQGVHDRLAALPEADELGTAVALVKRCIDEGRRVIRGIRPAELDDRGLVAAIEELGASVAGPPQVQVTTEGELDPLPESLRITIFRLCQEAITNARRHSGAGRIDVRVVRREGEVVLAIRDDGSGFEATTDPAPGFVLLGMAQRVRLADGTFTLDSVPGQGTVDGDEAAPGIASLRSSRLLIRSLLSSSPQERCGESPEPRRGGRRGSHGRLIVERCPGVLAAGEISLVLRKQAGGGEVSPLEGRDLRAARIHQVVGVIGGTGRRRRGRPVRLVRPGSGLPGFQTSRHVTGHDRAGIHRESDGTAHEAFDAAADVCPVRRVEDPVGLLLETPVLVSAGVGQHVARRDRLRPEVGDGQARHEGVRARIGAPGEVLGVTGLVQRDRRHVAEEVHRGRVRIVVVAAEQPARQERLDGDRDDAEGVAVGPPDGRVRPQPPPVFERRILIDPHLHVVELVVVQVVVDRLLGRGRDVVILDAAIPEDDLLRDAEDPPDAVDHGTGPAALDGAGGRRLHQRRGDVAPGERNLPGLQSGSQRATGRRRQDAGRRDEPDHDPGHVIAFRRFLAW